MPGKVLIIDDEPAIRQMVSLALKQGGFACLEAADAESAQVQILTHKPDLILLDWMLPKLSGIDYARRLRSDKLTQKIPVIMLTARTEEEDKLRGFDSGADDYITKPFSTRELLSRIKALLRRSAPHTAEQAVEARGLRLDPVTHRVSTNGGEIGVGPTEFRLLHFFMTHPERVHTREQLLNGVWGHNVYVEERTVDVHVRRLRRALAPSGHDALIQTVRGSGYRFSLER